MPTTVTLDIFSGRPNPSWVLPDKHSSELSERISSITQLTTEKPSGALGTLGYRGFVVHHSPSAAAPHMLSTFHVHEGIVDQGLQAPSLVAGNRELESWLLSSAGKALDNKVRPVVEEAISRRRTSVASGVLAPKPATKCPKCDAADAPPYNPGKWNIPTVQPYNNCYNYANDQITNTFAQPGKAHGKTIKALSCPGVLPCAQADGLVVTPNFSHALPKGKGWYVALVIWPNVDYHWYRQDNVGCWSHKPGSTAARNVDNSGKPITDPKTCDRGPYTVFCNYMITNRHVVIK